MKNRLVCATAVLLSVMMIFTVAVAASDAETSTATEQTEETVISRVDISGKVETGNVLSVDLYKSTTEGVDSVESVWYKNGEKVFGYNIVSMGRFNAYVTIKAATGKVFSDDVTVRFGAEEFKPLGFSLDKTTIYLMSPTTVISCLHGEYGAWQASIDTHTRYCSECGEVAETRRHEFGTTVEIGDATILICSVCGFEKTMHGLKTEVPQIMLDMPRLVEGNTLGKPKVAGEYDSMALIMSYQWYKDAGDGKRVKIDENETAEEGWYFLEVTAISRETSLFTEETVVTHPYGETDYAKSTDASVTTTIKIYAYTKADITVELPAFSPDKTIGDICRGAAAYINGNAGEEISLTFGEGNSAFMARRSSDGKWSLGKGGGTIDGLFASKILPSEKMNVEVEFYVGEKAISTDNLSVKCDSFISGRTIEIIKGWAYVNITLITDTDIISRIDIVDVSVPQVGETPSGDCRALDGGRLEIKDTVWNTKDVFKCEEKYTVSVTVNPKSGYKIDPSADATVNGVPAVMNIGSDSSVVTYSFPKLNHKYGDWKEEYHSCTEEGKAERNCVSCGKTEVKIIPAAEHELYEVKEVEATCVSHGKKAHFACKNCKELFDADNNRITDDELDIPTDASNHVGGEMSYDESGHFTLCRCGQKLNFAQHSFGAWKTTKPAEIGISGEKERSCSACGYKVTDEIPALTDGHTHEFTEMRYDDNAHWHVCECGETTAKENHLLDSNGICSVCGFKSEENPQSTSSNTHTTEPPIETTPGEGNIGSDTVIWVWVAVAAAMILAAVVFIAVAVKKKKK